MKTVIEFKKVTKKFKKSKRLYLKQALLDLFKSKKEEDFWALKDIDFKINHGETVGIIGMNGSGKSTILKLIAGVLTPTSGQIEVRGRVGSLIELGSGFHPELSGRDNIYLNGTILGLTKKEIYQKFDDIVNFAELWDFIDTPVKHYSSGMYMRLGFSIAVHIDPEILLVDEVLMVGDTTFQAKSFDVFNDFKNKGKTIIFVSHDLGAIKTVCSKMLVLKKGSLVYFGSTTKGIDFYNRIISEQEEKNIQIEEKTKQIATKSKRFGNGKVKITAVTIEDEKGRKTRVVSGYYFFVKLRLKSYDELVDPNPGVIIKNSSGTIITASNADWQGIKLGEFKKGTEVTIVFKLINIYEAGKYTITVNCIHRNKQTIYDHWDDMMEFYCQKEIRTGAVVNPKYEVYKN